MRTSQPAKSLSLSDITSKGSGLPGRYIVYGPEGCGKTSFGAQFPNPLFVQTKGESGLDALIDSGRLHDTAHLPECQSWKELLSILNDIANGDHSYQTLVIDTLNGAEPLCHDVVRARDFQGDSGKFEAFKAGYNVAIGVWRELLNAIDTVRTQKKMAAILLCHTKVETFKNPEGEDYDRYVGAMHKGIWDLTKGWADAILFMNFDVHVKEAERGKRAKAVGGQTRTMYCEKRAAWDAKNRHGLPEEIDMGNSAEEAFANFKAEMAAGRKVGE